jgi:hypothetical protein
VCGKINLKKRMLFEWAFKKNSKLIVLELDVFVLWKWR